MKEITRELLKEWAQNLNRALDDVKSRRSSTTHLDRQQKATAAANRSFNHRSKALAEVKSYIEVADSILKEEEARNGSTYNPT